MKLLLVAVLAVTASTTAQACTLSDHDIVALAESPSHITSNEIPKLKPVQLEMICKTRAFIAHVDAQKGIIKAVEPYSIRYVTAAKNERIVAASNAFIEKMATEKGRH